MPRWPPLQGPGQLLGCAGSALDRRAHQRHSGRPRSLRDRRYAIIYSDLQGRDHIEAAIGGADASKDYFDKLFDAIHHHPDLVAWWLLSRGIAERFNPTGYAPVTSCYDELIALSEHPTDSMFLELIEEHECDVINGDVVLTFRYLRGIWVGQD